MNARQLLLPAKATACGLLLAACGSLNFKDSQATAGSHCDEASRSPLHVVIAAHDVRQPGDIVVFRDAKGRTVERVLKALQPVSLPSGARPDHTSGGAGAGPYYGDPEVVAAINRRMSELGGGYQLTTARP